MLIQANFGKNMTTHMGVLIRVLQASDGDVVELGSGPSSTPLLHWLCKDLNRRLITYETDPEFYKFAKEFQSRGHSITFVKNWDSIDTNTHHGVVFIDHAPAERRGVDVIRFKDSADYVILHDTEKENMYGYEQVWQHFKYSYTWKECLPWVSVVSNFKDLSWLETKNPPQTPLKDLLTVLYYTSSREDPIFEQKIIENLLGACGDLPIVSVSQKPLNLGKNICVGNVGLSYLNEWRQILIGAKEVQTPYIIFAESDFLYPKEYFNFIPPKKGLYRYDNIWIVFKDTQIAGSYRRKSYSEGAQICDKETLISTYERYLANKPQWYDGDYKEISNIEDDNWIVHNMPFEFFSGETACISFKTGEGMRSRTNVFNKGFSDNRKMTLPYWGDVNDLRKKYLTT